MSNNELCAICGKRRPNVVISQVDQNGNSVTKKVCLACASKLGLPQVDDILKNFGIPEDGIDQLSDDIDAMVDDLENGNTSLENLLGEVLNDATENGSDDDNEADTEDSEEETSDNEKETEAESQKSATNTPDFFNIMKKLFGGINPGKNPGTNPFAQGERGSAANSNANTAKESKNHEKKNKSPIEKYKFLSQYGIDLNQKVKDHKIDPIIGRDVELERVIQILNRRSKNNPALIGEPGVGKTAIAEGLAMRIVEGKVPQKLASKIVVMLDLTAIVAGTQFRGQFESRMKGLIEDVKTAGNIILVIDEVHSIIGAGEAEGSLNAANILKPALSRGEIQLIGTTTLKEYRKYIEKDGALERRFQPVMVEEPTIKDTIGILKGIKESYENYHFVKISDDIIENAVRLSERYITDRFLPDKAIDVLDEAASRANLRNTVLKELAEAVSSVDAINKEIEALENKITEEKSKPMPVEQQDGEEANVVESAEVELFRQLAEKRVELAAAEAKRDELEAKKYLPVEYNDVARVIETWTGVPLQMITTEEAEKILALEDKLKMKIIGQDNAVSCVARAIRRNRSGFRNRFKPSSFIFAGPTGVGKTELVKQLAIELFGTIDSLIRLDMSEYMEKHTVSKLIGSPPGYVGYDEAGQLTEKVRRHPYSVILFDEIEKAHPDVFNMLLQILDDGRLTDSQGRVVNFENTVIILTTNVVGKTGGVSIGFGDKKQESDNIDDNATKTALKRVFKPEFLNRIDEIVLFRSLSGDSLKKIVCLMLKEIYEQCAAKGIDFDVTEEAIAFIAEKGYEEEYGARPLRRFIQKNIEDEFAELSLRGELDGIANVTADVADDKIVIIKN